MYEGDRLFAGTSTGSLQIYKLAEDADNVVQSELVTSKNLGRRAIEQIDYSKDINSLIVLSGTHGECRAVMTLTIAMLYTLDRFSCDDISAARPGSSCSIATDKKRVLFRVALEC